MITVPVFSQLYRRLRYLLRLRGQSKDDADDVIQDAFLRLQVYYRRGGEVREPEAFLVTTALRLSSNARRDTRRREVAEHGLAAFEAAVLATEATPEQLTAADQMLWDVNRRLRTLNSITREVFLLHRVEGMSYAQIAKLYGLTIKAVERRIARAMLAVFEDDAQ